MWLRGCRGGRRAPTPAAVARGIGEPEMPSPFRCDPERVANVTWASLGRRARTWRVLHAAWSVVQLAGLGHIWWSALRRRRSPTAWASVALLCAEGAALVVGRGNCPVGR